MLAPSAAPQAAAALDDEAEWLRFSRRIGTGPRALAESSLRIGGIHCAACAPTIEDALLRVAGVTAARVNAASRCVAVRWDPARTQPSALIAAVEAAGYVARPDTAADARAQRRQEGREALWRLFVAAFCAMQVMMMATPSYLSGPGELAPDLKQLLDWGSWLLSLPVMAFSAWPFLAGAWRSLRARRIGMDVPVALGILATYIASSGATFAPGGLFGSEVYFDSLTMFVSFLLAGRFLEMSARHRAALALEDTLDRLPQTVLRETADGGVEPVSALRLRVGDVLRVPRGQVFAADGLLLRGATQVDEALLNGESTPLVRAAGDAVIAGSVNLEAPVVMRVERVGADTRYEAIVALMRAARSQRPAGVAGADRWAARFLWGVLLLAAGAALLWSVVDPSRALWVTVSVLIVTCPCALSLGAPAAWLAAAGAMARRGLLLRRLEAIEALATMNTLFIDKTGTLTEAQHGTVRMRRSVDGQRCSESRLWAKAASLAAWSSHPLASALAAQQGGGDGGTIWHALQEQPGRGLQAQDAEGRVWRLGKGPGPMGQGTPAGEIESVETWLIRDGVPLACFSIEERLREGAAEAVRALQRDGVRLVLLSGDHPARVRRLARQLGLDDCRGGASPEDKLARLRAAQARGEIVAMLGDGINDAPVLAQADVSLAMGEGAQIARAQADGVLISNRLQDVVEARALARKSLRVARQNLAWAAAYNLTCVPLAVWGWLPPWAAGLGMASSSLLVVLNALRLSRRASR
ncbi:MAG: cation-translocating P-type ATPase [Burkholderiaceae bacterium]